jgi:hypothetical protein
MANFPDRVIFPKKVQRRTEESIKRQKNSENCRERRKTIMLLMHKHRQWEILRNSEVSEVQTS